MSETELAWLAGILEGEGSFCKPPPSDPKRPRISLEMTDEDIVQRVAKLFEVSYLHTRKYSKENHKDGFRIIVRGKKAVSLMKILHPLMGLRRQSQIISAVADYTEKPADVAKLDEAAVRDIRSKRLSMRKFAEIYCVAKGTIQRVQTHEYYKSVK